MYFFSSRCPGDLAGGTSEAGESELEPVKKSVPE
jgi:hypothetical protein